MSTYHVHAGYKRRRFSFPSRRLAIFGCAVIVAASVVAITKHPEAAQEAATKPASAAFAAAEPAKPPVRLTAPMPWPSYGHAAYGVTGEGVVAASDRATQTVPIASLAKIITAQTVLKEKPLKPGEQGPLITLDEEDVALFGEYIRKDGVVVPVEVGEQISQYQAMQAMLMTSANNMADILARWAFGSVENYTTHANKMIRDMGLKHTTVADASGFSPSTVSTAGEMTQLGITYMQNPVLREIATHTEAQIPVAGTIHNYNASVNEGGIVGIKIGNTDEAGRCFMAADVRQVNGKEQISVAVVLGADNLLTAMNDTRTVLLAGNTGYDQQAAQ